MINRIGSWCVYMLGGFLLLSALGFLLLVFFLEVSTNPLQTGLIIFTPLSFPFIIVPFLRTSEWAYNNKLLKWCRIRLYKSIAAPLMSEIRFIVM